MLDNARATCALLGAAAALGLLLTPEVADAQPMAVKIEKFAHAGSGCPAGTVGAVLDQENNLLTVNFDNFAAKLPPGESKDCKLSFVVSVPSQLQISMNRVEYVGYHDMEPGIIGTLSRTYKYGNNSPLGIVKKFDSSDNGDFYVVDQFPGWSVCTNAVTVNSNTRIDLQGTPSPNITSELVVDTVQYDTHMEFEFAVRPC